VHRRICGRFNSRTFMVAGIAFILFSSLGLIVYGEQEPSTSSAVKVSDAPISPGVYRSDTTIRIHSDLVLIPVTVTDSGGRVVSGLEKEHFSIFENDARQEITHFASEDAPVSIGIVFDASGSMEPKLSKARQAVNCLLDSANPDDEFFLVRFSSQARIVVPMTSRFGQVRAQASALEARGSTALLDGIRLAMAEMKSAHYSRKALIIISDGEDNSSRWTVPELNAAVREQDVLIYAIGLTGADYTFNDSGAALLRAIASQTGGRLFEVKKPKQLPDVTTTIGGWLRHQYVLGYEPSRSERDGGYRKVDLKIARPKGYPRLHAVWRQGYFAPKE
jgi:Ca-activated chloride channel homolog